MSSATATPLPDPVPSLPDPVPPPLSPPPPRAPGVALPSWTRLRAIADGQRWVIWAFLAGLLTLPAAAATGALTGGGSAVAFVWIGFVVALRIAMAVAAYRLAAALASSAPVLWAIGAFLPNILGLVVIVVLSSRATKRLRAVGLKVGFLGTKLPEEPPPGLLTDEVSRIFS